MKERQENEETMIEQLREQGVNEALLKQVEEFIKDHPLSEE